MLQTLAEESVSLASSTPYKSKVKKLCVEEIVVSSKKHDESELEEGELRDSRLTNATVNEYTFRSTSWVELLEEEEAERGDMQVSYSVFIVYTCNHVQKCQIHVPVFTLFLFEFCVFFTFALCI